MSDNNGQELYLKYRPTCFRQVVGQDEAVRMLEEMMASGRVPHSLLLTGPSGCGKTTIARILKAHLECGDMDFFEMNAADTKGIDTIRDIRSRMTLSPVQGRCRMWLIDEAHKLTNDAQTGLLKMLEDTPRHVYFVLATTDPGKLLKTIHTRCTEVRLGLLSQSHIARVVKRAVKHEGKVISEEVVDKLTEVADGSARKALVLLHSAIGLEDEEKQLAAICKGDSEVHAKELCQLFLRNPRAKWPEVASYLKDLKEEPEDVRRAILGYMTTVLLGGGKLAARAFFIITCFEDSFYNSGKAGLVRACYEVSSKEF